MGTKEHPGRFDCYRAADSNEPMFVLLGRDPVAALLVQLWVELRRSIGREETEKFEEARDCAEQMYAWADRLGKREQILGATYALSSRLRQSPLPGPQRPLECPSCGEPYFRCACHGEAEGPG